jgi:hypothetical protein
MAGALAGVVLIASSAFAVAPTSFAGTWVLDKAKSELSGQMAQVDSITWTITQDDKTITIDSVTSAGGQDRSNKSTYNLDGSETTAEVGGRMPGKATLKAKWGGDGKILELNSVRNISAQGQEFTIKTTEHLELAEGGKVLKVHRNSETPRGAQEAKMTFNKK